MVSIRRQLCRGGFLSILVFLTLATLSAQVTIKERVLIEPKDFSVKQSGLLQSDLPCLAGEVNQNSIYQTITALRRCKIQCSGSVIASGPFAHFLKILISVGEYDINRYPIAQGVACHTIPIELWTWTLCAIIVTNVTGSVTGNSATYSFTGYQSFPHPVNVPFTATLTLQAIPDDEDEPAKLFSEIWPTKLYGDDESTMEADLCVLVLNTQEQWFEYCGETIMRFTIENPVPGVTLNGEGNSVETRISGDLISRCIVVYDGRPLPNGHASVTVRIEALGFSTTQTLEVFQAHPCLIVSASKTLLDPGERVTLSMKKKIIGGSEILPFPEESYFQAATDQDEQYGKLRSGTGMEGTFVYGTQPFEFIAPDSLDVDSVNVTIRVGWEGSPLFSTGNTQNDQTNLLNRRIPQYRKALLAGRAITSPNIITDSLRSQVMKNLRFTDGLAPKPQPLLHPEQVTETILHNKSSHLAENQECNPMVVLTVKRKTIFDHFDVQVAPDTIYYGEKAKIKVIAMDASKNTYALDDMTPINIDLSEDESSGILQYYGWKGKSLQLPYCNARDGKVFIAIAKDYSFSDNARRIDFGVKYGTKSGKGSVVAAKFCQADSKWGAVQYDKYVKSIDEDTVYHTVSDKGCALTCMAMVARAGGVDINPGVLANRMLEPQHYGYNGHGVKWRTIDSLTGNCFYYDTCCGKGLYHNKNNKVNLDSSTAVKNSDMDNYLNQDALILALVYNPTTKGDHWVVVKGKKNGEYLIIDPGCYSGRTSLSGVYENKVYRFIVYEKKRITHN